MLSSGASVQVNPAISPLARACPLPYQQVQSVPPKKHLRQRAEEQKRPQHHRAQIDRIPQVQPEGEPHLWHFAAV